MTNPSRTGVTAGVAPGPRHAAQPPGRRVRKTTLSGVALAGLGLSLFVAPGTASAAAPAPAPLPDFPNNIVAFPDRDFISLEGFSGPVTIEVWRGDTLMGAASGTGPDMEVNHPGGRCWGWGADGRPNPAYPQVTPDLDTGDRIIVWQDGATRVPLAETTVQGPRATGVDYTPGTSTFTVSGTVPQGYDPANIEQRIVNPDLTGTPVARRDVRAVFDPATAGTNVPAAKGGYASRLEVSGTTFTAFYDFSLSDDPTTPANEGADVAAIAAGTDVQRALSWQLTDPAANRQGLTIAEFGEAGGPGFGGCPQGPGNATPTAGTYSVVRSGTSAQVNWSPAAAQPGAQPVIGYSVSAISPTADANGQTAFVGAQTGATATRATLTLPDATTAYKYEVRAVTSIPATSTTPASTALSAPFPAANGSTGPAPSAGDSVPPTITASQSSTGVVSFAAAAADGPVDIYYTTGNTPVLDQAGLPTQQATLFRATPPLTVTATTTFNFVGLDLAGNASEPKTFTATAAPTPAAGRPDAPAGVVATPGNGRIDLRWTAPTNTGNRPITGYTVTATAPAGPNNNPAPFSTTVSSTTTTAAVTGLTNGREYTFSVTATNGATPPQTSVASTEVKARPGDVVTLSLARNRAGDQRIVGSSNLNGATFQVFSTRDPLAVGNPQAPGTVRIDTAANTTLTPAVAPATGVSFEVRTRNAAAFSTGTILWMRSSGGGIISITV